MALAPADLQQVVDHIKLSLPRMLVESAPQFVVSSQLMERIYRVEEALKSQREVMEQRFEAQQKLMAARFDDVNRRFEDINRRFEDINKRFEDINKRFEAIDKRFEDLITNMNKRFGTIQWMVLVGFVFLGTVMSIIGLAG